MKERELISFTLHLNRLNKSMLLKCVKKIILAHSCLRYWFNELLSICSEQERKEMAFRWLLLFVFCFCLCQNECLIAIQANSPSRQLLTNIPPITHYCISVLHISGEVVSLSGRDVWYNFDVWIAFCILREFGCWRMMSHNCLSKPRNQWTR